MEIRNQSIDNFELEPRLDVQVHLFGERLDGAVDDLRRFQGSDRSGADRHHLSAGIARLV